MTTALALKSRSHRLLLSNVIEGNGIISIHSISGLITSNLFYYDGYSICLIVNKQLFLSPLFQKIPTFFRLLVSIPLSLANFTKNEVPLLTTIFALSKPAF